MRDTRLPPDNGRSRIFHRGLVRPLKITIAAMQRARANHTNYSEKVLRVTVRVNAGAA
jgi:hypothetical protein